MAFSSQRGSQNCEIPTITLKLAKFSYATNASLQDSHVPWIHLPERDTLVAMFDFSHIQVADGSWEDTKTLKVLRGAEIVVCTGGQLPVQPRSMPYLSPRLVPD